MTIQRVGKNAELESNDTSSNKTTVKLFLSNNDSTQVEDAIKTGSYIGIKRVLKMYLGMYRKCFVHCYCSDIAEAANHKNFWYLLFIPFLKFIIKLCRK